MKAQRRLLSTELVRVILGEGGAGAGLGLGSEDIHVGEMLLIGPSEGRIDRV